MFPEKQISDRFRDSKNNFSLRAQRNPAILNAILNISLHKVVENTSPYNLAQHLQAQGIMEGFSFKHYTIMISSDKQLNSVTLISAKTFRETIQWHQ